MLRIWPAFADSAASAAAPHETALILIAATAALIESVDAEAVPWGGRAVALSDRLGWDTERMRAHCNLASALTNTGHAADAEAPARVCLELSRKTGLAAAEAVALWRLGDAAYARGELTRAADQHSRALAINLQRQNHRDTALVLVARAIVERDQGRLAAARDDLARALDLTDAQRLDSLKPLVLSNLAVVLVRDGDEDGALSTADGALRAAENSGAMLARAGVLGARGLVRLHRLECGAALPDLRLALELYGACGNVSEQAHIAADMGVTLQIVSKGCCRVSIPRRSASVNRGRKRSRTVRKKRSILPREGAS